jgi:hypothetical protein
LQVLYYRIIYIEIAKVNAEALLALFRFYAYKMMDIYLQSAPVEEGKKTKKEKSVDLWSKG